MNPGGTDNGQFLLRPADAIEGTFEYKCWNFTFWRKPMDRKFAFKNS